MGGLDPTVFCIMIAEGDKIMATPPGILPLEPTVLFSLLWVSIRLPPTSTFELLVIHDSCMQYTVIMRSIIGSINDSNFLSIHDKPCTFYA